MDSIVDETVDGILNEVTATVHKSESDGAGFRTECGITNHLTHNNLQYVPVERAVARTEVTRCGRCFPGTGGY